MENNKAICHLNLEHPVGKHMMKMVLRSQVHTVNPWEKSLYSSNPALMKTPYCTIYYATKRLNMGLCSISCLKGLYSGNGFWTVYIICMSYDYLNINGVKLESLSVWCNQIGLGCT